MPPPDVEGDTGGLRHRRAFDMPARPANPQGLGQPGCDASLGFQSTKSARLL
jgi:hypothetical protein